MSIKLLGMGNPLLDISSVVEKDVLEKYGLENGMVILAEDKHLPMYAELSGRDNVEFIAGGATQNSIRVAQYMLTKEGVKDACAYMGCVGKDDNAKKLEESASKDGVLVKYKVDEETETGCCACCIVENERTLVTNLAAANKYTIDHLEQNWAIAEQASVFYSAGFFITVCPDAMYKVAKYAAENNKLYCLNLSAPFIIEVPPFFEVLTKLLPDVDYLFGNETEAATYAKVANLGVESVADIAKKLSEGDKKRTVVFTQGAEPTIVARGGELLGEFPVIKLAEGELVDTNGAGDAYVGGFLAKLASGVTDVAECCKAGAEAANIIVKTSGTKLPSA